MANRCVAAGCSNGSSSSVSLFKFPNDIILPCKWVAQVQWHRARPAVIFAAAIFLLHVLCCAVCPTAYAYEIRVSVIPCYGSCFTVFEREP